VASLWQQTVKTMRNNEDDATVCLRKQQGKGILDEEKALESRQF
jgi:hypothetical protein